MPNQPIRQRLTAAAARLRETGDKQLAEAVEQVLAPKGWRDLANDDRAGDPNFALPLPEHVLQQIREKAAAAGGNVALDINEGFRAFLDHSWTPTQKDRVGTGGKTKVLNSRPSAELTARVKEAITERQDDLGWKPGVTTIAAAWLVKKYDIDVTLPPAAKAD
ncbi:hypothetical protein [Streptomyces zhihengii]